MAVSKQLNILDELLLQLRDDDKQFCEPLIHLLLEIGYKPKRHKKSTFLIDFVKYSRVIVKFEIGHDGQLKFWMRYSACKSYPDVFKEAVKIRNTAWVKRGQFFTNQNIKGCCGLCNETPSFYHIIQDNGTEVNACGGYTKYIPDVTINDVPDILRMIKEQDIYFNETFA